MPFDAAMLAASISEMRIYLIGARVEKISVPEKEEVIIHFHTYVDGVSKSRKLTVCTYPDNSCVHMTEVSRENPAVPSGFCLLLRKNLIGARVTEIEQLGFERAVMISFKTTDEMGYPTERYLVAETMGKYSNLILLSNEKKVILASRLIEISLNSKRPILPGMRYENPPAQEKRDPLTESRESFAELYNDDIPAEKFIMRSYFGISPLISREIAHLAKLRGRISAESLSDAFFAVVDKINSADFSPTLLLDKSGSAVDFSFMPITQYGDEYTCLCFNSVGELLDRAASDKTRAANVRHRAADLLRTVQNAEKRLEKKIQILLNDIEASKDADKYRFEGELITGNIYMLKKGDKTVSLTDYSTDPPCEKTVELDPTKTPQQNAAIRFKKYNKLKAAKLHATEQLKLAREEAEYIDRVKFSLERADGETEIAEIRTELENGGYIRSKASKKPQKPKKPKPDKYVTSGGYVVYCGKNNIQNEYVTFKLSQKGDIWFHAKNMPGSHVLMVTNGEEPSAQDYTEAATIAAVNSSAKGNAAVEVDYTRVENVKKPGGSRIGFVIYKTNFSTSVVRDEATAQKLKKE